MYSQLRADLTKSFIAPSHLISLTLGGLEATPSQCTVASYPRFCY